MEKSETPSKYVTAWSRVVEVEKGINRDRDAIAPTGMLFFFLSTADDVVTITWRVVDSDVVEVVYCSSKVTSDC